MPAAPIVGHAEHSASVPCPPSVALDRDLGIARWLLSLWGLVLLMVAVGGLTRLTGSGLSMVDWRPLMGALPPLSEGDWQAVFAQYQGSPQFKLVNHWMTLSDFKRIFLWEYVHRLLGRLLGLWFAVPYVYFMIRGRLRGSARVSTALAFLLGGAQGLLGWYMVKSGLVDRPEVSHFRLAAHLSLAFFVGQYLLWLALRFHPGLAAIRGPVRRLFLPLWGLIVLQVIFGAFMAGTHAGLLFSSFPDMNGLYAPQAFFRFPGVVENLMHNPAAIHWTHRLLGFLLLGAALWIIWGQRSAMGDSLQRRAAILFVASMMVQFVLGAATVMLLVPVWLAASHQVGAFLLLSSAVFFGYVARDPQP